jgi:hypothetical protein
VDVDILEMLEAQVQIAPRVNKNIHGDAQYGQLMSVPAHITYKTQMLYDSMGNELISVADFYVDGSVDIDPTYKVVLPHPNPLEGLLAGKSPKVVHIESHCSDSSADSYYKRVWVGV